MAFLSIMIIILISVTFLLLLGIGLVALGFSDLYN